MTAKEVTVIEESSDENKLINIDKNNSK